MELVKRVSMFPVGGIWTVIVEYEHSVERRDFPSRANAEWFKEYTEGRINQQNK